MLTLRLLGELEVLRGEEKLPLPPSKKTRALLAYLAATGRPHRRERLCSIFWEVPNDPRGALRWSVSRLRAVLNAPEANLLTTTRDTVALECEGLNVDLLTVRRAAAGGLAALAPRLLQDLARSFRGEFLEGLDLPDQHDFQSWCIAEREDLRRLQIEILTLLAERLADIPDEAVQPVRQLVQIDPFNETARIELLRLLLASGRRQEATSHFETAERLFRDIDDEAPYRLRRAWRDLVRQRETTPAPFTMPISEPAPRSGGPKDAPASRPAAATPGADHGGLVGRSVELAALLDALELSANSRRARLVTVSGEPGIGKSRLVASLAAEARTRGLRTLTGCSYDAELGSAYVPWTEALGGLPEENEPVPPAAGREKLFAAIAADILGSPGAVLIVLEDLHWADEASADLLHYLLRVGRNHPVAER